LNGASPRATEVERNPMSDTVIRIRNLHKRFGDLHVVKGVDLEVKRGERIAIIGASGSGKSTILRCLNFMEMPSDGTIELDGKVLGAEGGRNAGRGERSYSETELCEVRTRVGMVFQQFNLFPHMTVLENVMEGLITVKRMPNEAARARAAEQLAKVGLQDKFEAYPGKLSGGQQQRVAIARALAMDPEVLLFDEPTSSLDPELVGEVLRVIHALAEEGRTMLLVTHELGFAYHFADRVVFIADGVVYETGTADDVLKHPKKERTQAFLARFTERAF
jgi:polar amino acid transport system ATP-binding protein